MVELTPDLISWLLAGVATGIAIGATFGGILGYIITRDYYKKADYDEMPPADWSPPLGMDLVEAKLCLDCDLAYARSRDSTCPRCASSVWVYISHWLKLPELQELACSEHCDDHPEQYFTTCND